MVRGVVRYNHANAKREEGYWYGLFYPLFLKGMTASEIKKSYSKPTLKKRAEAYEKGLSLAQSDYNSYLSALQQSYNAGAGDLGSGVVVSEDGKVIDLRTGQVIDRYAEKSNLMLYVLIGVAVLVLVLIFRKKKG